MNNKIKLPSDVLNLVRKVAEAEHMKCFEIGAVETNKKGEGFTGNIYAVTVLDKNDDTKLNLLIKKAFDESSVRDKVPVRDTYENEIYFYKHLYPSLQVFQKANSSATSCEDLLPRCFDVCLDDGMEALVLDNLKSGGFKVFSKKLLLDADHVELIFKKYGYFHALSFAFKHKKSDEFSKITSSIKGVCGKIFDTEFYQVYFTNLFNDINDSWMSAEQDDDDTIRREFQKYLQKPYEIIQECLKCDDKYAVVLHGDCWSNNMLFKYEKETGKPVDLKLIDWQLVNTGNPVCDLSYALYSGAAKAVYDNYEYYLKIYHDNFALTLKQFGLDADQLYPLSVLKEHWKFYCKFGIFMAVMVIRVKVTDDDDMLDFTDTADAEDFRNIKFNSEEFFSRAKDLFRHLYVVERT